MTLPWNRPRVKHPETPTSQYHQGDIWSNGALSKVYEPAPPVFAAMLPVVNIIGHGIYAGQLYVWQGPQVRVSQAAFVAGIGGVVGGTVIQQPLNVPETTNGTQ